MKNKNSGFSSFFRLVNTQFLSFKNDTKKWSSEEKNLLKAKIAKENNKRILAFSIFLFILEIINILICVFMNIHGKLFGYYVLSSIVLIIVAAIYILIAHLIFIGKITNIFVQNFTYKSFLFAFSLGMFAFCILDLMESREISNFVFLMCSLAIIPILSAIEIISIVLFDVIFFTIISYYFELRLCIVSKIFFIGLATILISTFFKFVFLEGYVSKKKLKSLSKTDPLTNLLNRRGGDKMVFTKIKELTKETTAAVIMIDVDCFKEYNDGNGHKDGDDCLIFIANQIEKIYKYFTDVIVRYGGDEFLVVLFDINKDNVLNLSDNLMKNINKNWDSNIEKATVSMGISFTDKIDVNSFPVLFNEADNELYNAKKSGKNCISFESKIYSCQLIK